MGGRGRTPGKAGLEHEDEEYGGDACGVAAYGDADGFGDEDDAHADGHGDEEFAAPDAVDHPPLRVVSRLVSGLSSWRMGRLTVRKDAITYQS